MTINERTGEVSLGQAPKEFAGGVFESRIASSDISNTDVHIATSKLKVLSLPTFFFCYKVMNLFG